MSKKYSNRNLYALILAGGVGSRFWPFSREHEPKQFINIIGKEGLLQNTLRRIRGLVRTKQIFFITNQSYFYELKKQIERFGIPDSNIILEPEGKNTAPAIGLCARLIGQDNKDAILIALPSDHYIKDLDKFRACLRKAADCALDGFLVTIGIKPKNPETGYGYIKIRRAPRVLRHAPLCYAVEKFLEKPSLDKAKRYAAGKNYFWNSGMFVWKAAVFMEEVSKHLPHLYSSLMSIAAKDDIAKVWPRIKPISVDYGIMEHSRRIALIPGDFGWSDLGSWDALHELLPKDRQGNVIRADLMDYESSGICAFSRSSRLIATIGLKDMIIADTPDAILVCDKRRAQDVKKIVERLKSGRRKERTTHMTDRRPWGSYTVLLSAPGFKIKLIEIEPGKRLSLQRHRRRAEHWVVVSGRAKVKSGKYVKLVRSNQSIYIPREVKHRLENPAKSILRIVEVQTGAYLEEDDIERFEDDFNR